MFYGDRINSAPITDIYLKNLDVFLFQYCSRHQIDPENLIELNAFINQNDGTRSLLIGCERVIINTDVKRVLAFGS